MSLVVINSKKNKYEVDYSLFEITKPCLLPSHLVNEDNEEKELLKKPSIKIYNENYFDKLTNNVIPLQPLPMDNKIINKFYNQHRYSLINVINDEKNNLPNDEKTIKCYFDRNCCKNSDANYIDCELNSDGELADKLFLLTHSQLNNNTNNHHHCHYHQRHRNHSSSGFT